MRLDFLKLNIPFPVMKGNDDGHALNIPYPSNNSISYGLYYKGILGGIFPSTFINNNQPIMSKQRRIFGFRLLAGTALGYWLNTDKGKAFEVMSLKSRRIQ